MGRRNSLEVQFETELLDAGFCVSPPRPIRTESPVLNRHGIVDKVVTTPDLYVTDPKTGKSIHVEITNGTGKGDHKAAQLRVVQSAGVQNYVQVTKYEVRAVQEATTREAKRFLIFRILYLLMML